MTNSTNFKIDKWLKELEGLLPHVFHLTTNNTDFSILAKRYNTKVLEPYVWEFIKRNYVTYMSMAIRRLVDTHKDAISLWKLVNDIEVNSSAFTRRWFLSQWPDGESESTFINFFGSSPTLLPTTVARHKSELESITKLVIDRADQYEAHIDRKPSLDKLPTFNDIDASVKKIGEVYEKYYYLLKQASISV